MTDRERDDEIKRALIADAASPDAWERVGVVPASTSPRPSWYGKSRSRDVRQIASHRKPPVDRASREEEVLRRKQLHDAIAALPEGQRHAIQLWLDGFHYTDIAHVLGVTVASVKSRLRDAKRHLSPALEETNSVGNRR